MRRLRIAWLCALVACGGPSPPRKAKARGPISPARLLDTAALARAGATVRRISDTESLVCGDSCLCLKDLDCDGGACITLEENLAAFRAALGRDTRRVSCELADTGRYCDLSYFRFVGDIYRYEVRYFGPDGHLVGQSNTTDYPAYCGGKAMRQFEGKLPDCAMPPRDVEVICADDASRGRAGQLVPPQQLLFRPR